MTTDMQECFKEARKHYWDLLDHAEPMPESTLTVDSINTLYKDNQKLKALLRELYTLIFCSNVDSSIQEESLKLYAKFPVKIT